MTSGGLFAGHDSLRVARTCGFTTLVLAQLFNAFNSRSETTSAFHRLFVNGWLWAATAFGTASPDGTRWLVCVSMASVVLWFEEGRKTGNSHRVHDIDGTLCPVGRLIAGTTVVVVEPAAF